MMKRLKERAGKKAPPKTETIKYSRRKNLQWYSEGAARHTVAHQLSRITATISNLTAWRWAQKMQPTIGKKHVLTPKKFVFHLLLRCDVHVWERRMIFPLFFMLSRLTLFGLVSEREINCGARMLRRLHAEAAAWNAKSSPLSATDLLASDFCAFPTPVITGRKLGVLLGKSPDTRDCCAAQMGRGTTCNSHFNRGWLEKVKQLVRFMVSAVNWFRQIVDYCILIL